MSARRLSVVCLGVCLHLLGVLSSEGHSPWVDHASREAFMKPDAKDLSPDEDLVSDGTDLVLTRKQYMRLYHGVKGRHEGTVASTPWTNGVVPYQIMEDQFSQEQVDWIHRAMVHWENVTCVQFRPAMPSDNNWIKIVDGQGCWATLGMNGGAQVVNLDTYGCFWKGTIEHELGHALGLIHEHQRPQRDEYIKVDYYATQTTSVSQLTKYAEGSDDKLGLSYDYDSVMHYGKTAFSRNYYTQTIYPMDPRQTDVIGMILGPSFTDAKLINKFYKCSERCDTPHTCPEGCYLTKDCTCFCSQDMPKEVCMDHSDQCEYWAGVGDCDSNYGYMHDKCRKACGICTVDGSIPHLPCVNRISEDACHNFTVNGTCESDSALMRQKCKKSCSFCKVNETYADVDECDDKLTTCASLAEQGHCDRYPETMVVNCKRSCNFCLSDVGVKPTAPPGTCVDFDTVCSYWKANGRCVRNYAVMATQCREACGTCGVNVTIPDGCVDTHQSCQGWAFSGECDNNPGYMHSACKLSCNVCPGLTTPDDCVDFDFQCEEWKDAGDCENKTAFMKFTCRKSCDFCSYTPPVPCYDVWSNCEEMKEYGDCESKPDQMESYCKKTCNICQLEGCEDFSPDCSYWASTGECQINPFWMSQHCRKSCGVCTVPCEDKRDDCEALAQNNGCSTNFSFMVQHCTKTCDKCFTVNTPGPCDDFNVNCAWWAERGECEANPNYMLKTCKHSCGSCEVGGSTAGRPTTTEGPCVDNNENCQSWAEYEQCEKNPGYMLEECKKSCNVCSDDTGPATTMTPVTPVTPVNTVTTAGPCTDESDNCPGWAASGECSKNPGYMLLHCKLSCDLCSGPCIDHSDNCPGWADYGECTRNPGYMLRHCKVSCNVCSPAGSGTTAGPSCTDDSGNCPGWADYGECTENPGYMLEHCKLSCGVC
ncbi:uncharacterized protein LOC143288737 [Babylonia areolata]|uniref:uncharacterized protein LOC143288737 n=1 Tax=Babylonia areolata TaxID=304850 RepID=UPI003FD39B0B